MGFQEDDSTIMGRLGHKRGAHLRGQPLPNTTLPKMGTLPRRVTSLWLGPCWGGKFLGRHCCHKQSQSGLTSRGYPATGHPCTARNVRAMGGTSTDWQSHDQWPLLLQNLGSNCCWTTGNHGNACVAQAMGAMVPEVIGGILAPPEWTII